MQGLLSLFHPACFPALLALLSADQLIQVFPYSDWRNTPELQVRRESWITCRVVDPDAQDRAALAWWEIQRFSRIQENCVPIKYNKQIMVKCECNSWKMHSMRALFDVWTEIQKLEMWAHQVVQLKAASPCCFYQLIAFCVVPRSDGYFAYKSLSNVSTHSRTLISLLYLSLASVKTSFLKQLSRLFLFICSGFQAVSFSFSGPKYDSEQPSYPGFERDVFKTVSDYFYSLPLPLLTFELYELFINVLGKFAFPLLSLWEVRNRSLDFQRMPVAHLCCHAVSNVSPVDF